MHLSQIDLRFRSLYFFVWKFCTLYFFRIQFYIESSQISLNFFENMILEAA